MFGTAFGLRKLGQVLNFIGVVGLKAFQVTRDYEIDIRPGQTFPKREFSMSNGTELYSIIMARSTQSFENFGFVFFMPDNRACDTSSDCIAAEFQTPVYRRPG